MSASLKPVESNYGIRSEYGHLIGGEWIAGSSGKTIALLNPATGETLTRIQAGNAEDRGLAVAAADDGQPVGTNATGDDIGTADDDTVNCALSVLYSDGTLGPGDLSQHPAPAGAAELSAFAMNVVALNELSDKFEAHTQVLIDRAVNIARGGNGQPKPGAA